MEEQTRELQNYLAILRKRKKSIFIIMASIFTIAVLVAVLLPPTYRSSATILIEQQEIPKELVQSTVTSYAAEVIQIIQARVMSRANLLEIIKKFNLYVDKRKFETTEQIVERMRDDSGLDVISADVIDPRTGRPSEATIAFKLSFTGESPGLVQKVANELTTLYLGANIKRRTKKAEETSVFIKGETERLGLIIEDLEAKLAIFKLENADTLPQLNQINQAMKLRLESQTIALETRLQTLEERKFYLSGQLALINPGDPGVLGVSARMKRLESEYATARSRYSENHPDVQRLKREVDGLRTQVGRNDRITAYANELVYLRGELAALTKKFTPDHPDVIRVEQQISVLEQNVVNEKASVEDQHFVDNPNNPAYITLKAQLEGINSEVRSNEDEKAKHEAQYIEIENRLRSAPEVERQYLTLKRDYDNAVAQYRVNKAKEARADVAKQLEAEKKGERFILIDPAALPEEPISPNRPALMFLGILLSVGGGIGFAFVADTLAGAIRGVKHIHALVGAFPLAVLPYQVNAAELLRRKQSRQRTIIFFAVLLIIFILLFHFLITPLDVMWFRVMRKYDILMS